MFVILESDVKMFLMIPSYSQAVTFLSVRIVTSVKEKGRSIIDLSAYRVSQILLPFVCSFLDARHAVSYRNFFSCSFFDLLYSYKPYQLSSLVHFIKRWIWQELRYRS
jgi:hypothetical protein